MESASSRSAQSLEVSDTPNRHSVHNIPNEFEIEGVDGEVQTASNGRIAMTVYPDGESRMRKRNAIKKACSPKAYKVQWLFGEIGDVRCYVREENGLVSIVMTKQDLYP